VRWPTRQLNGACLLALLACRTTLEPDVAAPPHDPSDLWEVALRKVVDADGYVDYDRLEERREVLDLYVAFLGTGRIPQASLARYAYWINAYNALVLFTVLEEGRPASVLDVPPAALWRRTPGAGFFGQRAFRFGPDRLSLSEIEDERLRMVRQDIRLHAAINRGSTSSPPLRRELYDGRLLERQLEDQMIRWVNDPDRGVRIEGDTAVMTPIFDWYPRDFRDWTAGDDLCTMAARYAIGALRQDLTRLAGEGCPHRFFEYDWSLNHRPWK